MLSKFCTLSVHKWDLSIVLMYIDGMKFLPRWKLDGLDENSRLLSNSSSSIIKYLRSSNEH
uniref:Uncharacterized protein n=1 Tax=Lotus japonicus TaxID=34305 RepID=I3SNJ3_LOTJA|nr:unknown [Lotus japonicus]